MEDGLQIANSMIALQNYNEQNADRWTKNQAGAIALEQGENFDPNAASEKMKADPRFRAGAFQDSVEAQFHKMLNSEEFQTKKAQNSTLRAQITRNNIKAHANKAVGMWQAGDIEGAENEFLAAWDTVYDGKEIVRDESGAPIIDKEKNTIQVRTRGGEVKAIPKPTIEQMYKLASTASQEGFLEEAYPGWDKERAGYNLVQMKNTGMRWETEDGRKIITVENQYDPESNKKIPLVARDAETGEDIPIDQLSMMELKQVGPLFESQKEPKGDYAQFVQYKQDNPNYKGDFLAFTKDMEAAKKKGQDSGKGGANLDEIKKQLELVLMPLGKGVSEVVDIEGNVTREAQSAFQVALKNVEKFKADPGAFKTDEDKAILAASKKAVSMWQENFSGGSALQGPTETGRAVVRTGTDRKTGKKVVQYSDGTIEYAE